MPMDLVRRLNALVTMDHDAADAYERAIPRVEDDALRDRMRAFLTDHRRHLLELGKIVSRLGGHAHERGDFAGVVLRLALLLQAIAGDAIALRALRAGETLARTRYGALLSDPECPPDIRAVVRRHYDDVERHYAWFREALEGDRDVRHIQH